MVPSDPFHVLMRVFRQVVGLLEFHKDLGLEIDSTGPFISCLAKPLLRVLHSPAFTVTFTITVHMNMLMNHVGDILNLLLRVNAHGFLFETVKRAIAFATTFDGVALSTSVNNLGFTRAALRWSTVIRSLGLGPTQLRRVEQPVCALVFNFWLLVDERLRASI